MKSKYWILLLAAALIISLALSLMLMGGSPVTRAEISSEGKILKTVDLNIDQEFTITVDSGTNTITVKDGAIAVTAADCPDQYCVARGFCNSGTQIVCLPHRLVIRFLDNETIDGMVG